MYAHTHNSFDSMRDISKEILKAHDAKIKYESILKVARKVLTFHQKLLMKLNTLLFRSSKIKTKH